MQDVVAEACRRFNKTSGINLTTKVFYKSFLNRAERRKEIKSYATRGIYCKMYAAFHNAKKGLSVYSMFCPTDAPHISGDLTLTMEMIALDFRRGIKPKQSEIPDSLKNYFRSFGNRDEAIEIAIADFESQCTAHGLPTIRGEHKIKEDQS